MTNSLNSPIEALPSLDYAFTIILNNVWTCLAVLTAGAVSFIWTTNKASSPPLQQVSPLKHEPVKFCSEQLCEPVSKDIVSTPAVKCTDGEVITRGKFVVYYYNDAVNEEENDRGNINVGFDEVEYDDVNDDAEKLVFREWEMGWYRYTDLTVFNGNVVRLWDDSRYRRSEYFD